MSTSPSPSSSSPKLWTLSEVLAWTSEKFRTQGLETPLLDAQLLLCHALQLSKIKLYTEGERPLTQDERNILKESIKRRLQGEPIAYITQEKYFYDMPLYVDKRVLIPRPETELIIDFCMDAFGPRGSFSGEKVQVIIDFCTGSGCLGLVLAKKFPDAQVIAVDISSDALQVARHNAQKQGIENIVFLERDILQKETYAFLKEQYGCAQIIVANPPYVSHQEWSHLLAGVRDYEPKLALVSDEEGLHCGRAIAQYVEDYQLMDCAHSVFCMELGEGHPHKIRPTSAHISYRSSLAQKPENTWFDMGDLDGRDRFLCKILGKLSHEA